MDLVEVILCLERNQASRVVKEATSDREDDRKNGHDHGCQEHRLEGLCRGSSQQAGCPWSDGDDRKQGEEQAATHEVAPTPDDFNASPSDARQEAVDSIECFVDDLQGRQEHQPRMTHAMCGTEP